MMRITTYWVAVLLVGALHVLPMTAAVAFGGEKEAIPSGQKVFETKCLQCHKQSKFRNSHYDRRTWEQIVMRMERNTCILSDAEYDAVCDYLAKEHGD